MGKRITIIKDGAIYVDGVVIENVNMSGVIADFHALQWNGTDEGEIEYIGNIKPNLTISSEAEIETELGVSLETFIARRETKIYEDAHPIMP